MGKPPVLDIIFGGQTAVYRQIVDQIRTYCVIGELRPGDPMPSLRAVADGLGLHPNTIAMACRVLKQEGWIEVSHGKAVTVAEREEVIPPDDLKEQENRVKHLVVEMRGMGLTPKWIRAQVEEALGLESTPEHPLQGKGR